MQINFPNYFSSVLDNNSFTIYPDQEEESIISGLGTIGGNKVSLAISDFSYKGGSLSRRSAQNLIRAIEESIALSVPLLLVISSGGVRVHEGINGLIQMSEVIKELTRCKKNGILTIGILTNPTMAGVFSSYATLLDILIAEPKATLGFTGLRVLEGTPLLEGLKEKQTSENYFKNGFIDRIIEKKELHSELKRLLSIFYASKSSIEHSLSSNNIFCTNNAEDLSYLTNNPWDTVQLSRSLERPQTTDYINNLFEDIFFLEGDRLGGGTSNTLIGGIASFGGKPMIIIGTQKGSTFEERKKTNFGMCKTSCYRKGIRLMKLAEKLRLPLMTLIDTPAADPSSQSEDSGIAYAISESIETMINLNTNAISIITGEGGSGGALALVAKQNYMLEKSIFTVIPPEGYSAIVWKNRMRAPEATNKLDLTAYHALKNKHIQGVIYENNLFENIKYVIADSLFKTTDSLMNIHCKIKL